MQPNSKGDIRGRPTGTEPLVRGYQLINRVRGLVSVSIKSLELCLPEEWSALETAKRVHATSAVSDYVHLLGVNVKVQVEAKH